MERIVYDSHMHTPFCKHAEGLPGEYAAVAEQRNLAGIIVTCHTPLPDGYDASVRMSRHELDDYVKTVQAASDEWGGRVDVLLGLESDFVPGFEEQVEEVHRSAPFNYILGSVHPQTPDYMKRFYRDGIKDYQKLYFEHLALAAESGLFDALSHPDIVKNSFPADWHPEEIEDQIFAALARIAKTGKAMELNTSGELKALPEMNPALFMLREMRRLGIPVVLGSDSHTPKRVASGFEQAIEKLEEAGYAELSYFKGRQRIDIPLKEARRSLRALSE